MINDYLNTITLGDCIEIMKAIPDNCIACCITDPPYNYEFIGKEWDSFEIKRRTNRIQNSSTLVKNIPYGSGLAGGVRNKNWYKKNRENIIDYQGWIREWGKELFRILKPGSYVFTFNSTRTIAHVQVALEDVGFYARDIIVWKRHSGIPKGLNVAKKLEKMGQTNSNDWQGWHSCLRNEWEAISVVQKPLVDNYIKTLEMYNVGLLKVQTNKGFQSNIFEGIKKSIFEETIDHVTVKPIELIKKLIEMAVPKHGDNVVIDPFIGSGTTAIASLECGVSYIGIDKDVDYIKMATKRIASVG